MELQVKILKVEEIIPMEGCDKIEAIKVLGYNCIVGKGQYKVGDLVVFFPPDSILTDELKAKMGIDDKYLKKGNRVSRISLRGIFSEGLVVSVNLFDFEKVYEGVDVTGILGVTKWQPPATNFNKALCNSKPTKDYSTEFYIAPYTDIQNIKNYPNVFEDNEFIIATEKIHGACSAYTKATKRLPIVFKLFGKVFKIPFIKARQEVLICSSHNKIRGWIGRYLEDNDGSIWVTNAKKYNIFNKLPYGYTVYGEIFGKGIQDLTYDCKDNETKWAVFDVRAGTKFLSWLTLQSFCANFGFPIVPVIKKFNIFNQDEIFKFIKTHNVSTFNPDQIMEGIVIKPMSERYDDTLRDRVILKCVTEEYLLRKSGTEFK